jgi:hypothetical protein
MTDRLTTMPLDELRAERAALQHQDDVISYVRRIAQARLDLLDAEMERRLGDRTDVTGALPSILASHLTAEGPPRPPRPAGESSDHPLAIELEEMCARLGADDVKSLDDAEVDELRIALISYERARSQERHDLYETLDALSAELVRRYREGEAHVDRLLDED